MLTCIFSYYPVRGIEHFHTLRGFRVEKLFMPSDLNSVLSAEVRAHGPPAAFHSIILARVDTSAMIMNQIDQ